MIEANPTVLPGVWQLEPREFRDARGQFVKTFHRDLFRERLGVEFVPVEQYYSVSRKNVLRGLHFQTPPADHAKLVSCPRGRVLDVVVDLRRASQTFGQHIAVELSETNRHGLFIPHGCAHGFLVLSDEDALILCATSSVHSPTHDAGIRWDSFGFDWPCAAPILSARDVALPGVAEFDSPF